jgi:hypothetical protein
MGIDRAKVFRVARCGHRAKTTCGSHEKRWKLIFPQMANWLPESERDQLRFEFEAELKRLNLAA